MKIVLAGYMGSGKTAVGRVLAAELSLPFLDLDQEIEKQEQRRIAEIFETSGEIYFRKKESQCLADLVGSTEDFVLSLGGGTPCYGKNLELLKNHDEVLLVFLKTSLQELLRRLSSQRAKRPLIRHLSDPGELEDFIRKHLFERNFYYNQSELIISTDTKSPEQLAREIEQALH